MKIINCTRALHEYVCIFKIHFVCVLSAWESVAQNETIKREENRWRCGYARASSRLPARTSTSRNIYEHNEMNKSLSISRYGVLISNLSFCCKAIAPHSLISTRDTYASTLSLSLRPSILFENLCKCCVMVMSHFRINAFENEIKCFFEKWGKIAFHH